MKEKQVVKEVEVKVDVPVERILKEYIPIEVERGD